MIKEYKWFPLIDCEDYTFEETMEVNSRKQKSNPAIVFSMQTIVAQGLNQTMAGLLLQSGRKDFYTIAVSR